MDKSYLVSIIVPVYNVELYIKECLDSLINQTYSRIEIILVDDGATDRSGEICDEYAKKDSRIVCYHKANGGLSDARNYGIDRANGDFLVFVDSDDFVEKNMIEKLLSVSIDTKSDIVACGIKPFCSDSIQSTMPLCDSAELDREKALEYLISGNRRILLIVAWNKLYKRELFASIRYPLKKIHEDEFIVHELLNCAKKVVIIPDQLYDYRQRDGSIMASESVKTRFDAVEAFYNRLVFFLKEKKHFLFGATFLASVAYLGDIYNDLKKDNNKEYMSVYLKWRNKYKKLWKANIKKVKNVKRRIVINLYFVNNNLSPNNIKRCLRMK